MCLGIAMQILKIDGWMAQCHAAGVERDVNLYLLQDTALDVGDYVLVHVGYAIQKIQAERAQELWQWLDQMAEANNHA